MTTLPIPTDMDQEAQQEFQKMAGVTLEEFLSTIGPGPGVQNSFDDHKGRPGQRGGSLPRDAGGATEGKKELVNTLDNAFETRSGMTGKVKDETLLAIVNARQHGIMTGNERLIGVDQDGQMIFSRDGTNDGVQVEGLALNKAHITIHNHPSSTSFSAEDMHIFNDFDNQKHMAVVGHNGDIYLMSKPDDWKRKLSADGVYHTYDYHVRKSLPLYHKSIAEGKSQWEASRIAKIDLLEGFADVAGMKYQVLRYGVDYGYPQ